MGVNAGGGGVADSTVLVRELLNQAVPGAGAALIRNPEFVVVEIMVPVGVSVTVSLGSKTDASQGNPLTGLTDYTMT